ncbi:MAG: hypothetical protein DMF24_02915 [Verrucomicrobia bacterium]|nr:MAG: hypothetical protein DME90_04745 [Verrucomicrobiota bacterium]PYL62742.1 MAG: hypothetical protein DMF24_02915 [Verrucomicrobiota bacterium]
MRKIRRYSLAAIIQIIVLIMASSPTRAEDPTTDGYVTRKEYDELKAQLLAMKKELDTLKKEREAGPKQEHTERQVVVGPHEVAPSQGEAVADTHKQVATEAPPPVVEAEGSLLGTTKFLLAGWAEAMYEQRNGSASTFSASLNPIFLWELTPKILFDGRLEIEPSGSGTNVNLVNAQISYLFNDYIAFGVGEFFSPSNVFVERFEPQWINKLPDRPIGVYQGVLPNISVGAQVRGGFPIGPTRVDYAFYVSNGPTLSTFNARTAGELDFSSYTDNNDDKAIGGRVGFLPIPGVEVGYGFETSRPGFQGTAFADLRALVQSVDLEVTRNSDLLKGRVNLFAQYAWSRVDHAVYDPDGSLGFGPLPLTAKRDGGYAAIAYRPTQLDIDLLRNFEMVFRWDHLSAEPSGLGDPSETRWTIGLDYWLSPSTVIKAAYEWDKPNGERNRNALFFQTAMGF